MSDLTPISIEDAIEGLRATDSQEQPETEVEEQQEANADSELLDFDEEQPEGDSETDEDSEALDEHQELDEEDEEPVYTVTVGDKQHEVTLEELQKGYMLQADYTRGRQELAEQRREVTEQAEQAQARAAEVATYLQTIETMFFGTPPVQPDIALLQTDRDEYERQKVAYEQWHQGKSLVDESRKAIEQQRQEEDQTKHQEYVHVEAKKFFDAFPDVTDEATMTAKVGALQSFALEYGYTPQELTQVVDHRAYVVLNELMTLKAQFKGAKRKARLKTRKAKTKNLSSDGSQRRPVSAREKANQRFNEVTKRTGNSISVNDAIDAAVDAILA